MLVQIDDIDAAQHLWTANHLDHAKSAITLISTLTGHSGRRTAPRLRIRKRPRKRPRKNFMRKATIFGEVEPAYGVCPVAAVEPVPLPESEPGEAAAVGEPAAESKPEAATVVVEPVVESETRAEATAKDVVDKRRQRLSSKRRRRRKRQPRRKKLRHNLRD